MVTNNSDSELYRFTSVRAINTHLSDALNKRFIVLNMDPDVATMQQKYPNSLFFNLNTLNSYPPNRLKVLVDQEVQTSKIILTPATLVKDFPYDISEFYTWIYASDYIKLADLEKKMTDLYEGGTKGFKGLKAFLNNQAFPEKKFSLYETLALNYLVPDPPNFLDTIQDMIRFIWIIQRILQPDNIFACKLDGDPKLIEQAARATIVLPLEKPYSPALLNNPNVPANQNTEIDDAKKRLNELNDALKDIMDKHSTQIIDNTYSAKYFNDRKKDENSANVPKPVAVTWLASRYVDALVNNTHKVIDSFKIPKDDGLNVNHIKERIENERNKIIERYFPTPKPPIVVNINGRFIQAPTACIPYLYDPCAKYTMLPVEYRKVPMRTPGWADLKVIKSTLLKYSKGEIAHIENVLKGEIKIREFNVTTKTEDTIMTDEETTQENQKELESTDRNEMERELSNQVKEDMKFDTGVKVSAKLGTVQLDTHLDFAYNSSKEESNKTSTKTAQEIVSRALSKVIERKRTQRTVSTIITTEDKNSHTLKNDTMPTDNIHGMYFWVDKYYLAKVVNYGSRYMLEFMVPEPAAFYLYSKINKPQPENAKRKPDYPQVIGTLGEYRDIVSFEDITEKNYAELAGKFDASDINPPPAATYIITESIEVKDSPDEIITHETRGGPQTKFKQAILADKTITVEDGYEPERGWVTVAGWELSSVNILLGNVKKNQVDLRYTQEFTLNKESKTVPFGVWGFNTGGLTCNVEILCNLSASKWNEWRINTFNSIIAGYNNQLSVYEKWQTEQEINSGISIQGNNPEINRRIEKEELKKLCIELMTGQSFEAFNAVNNNVAPLGYPEVVPDKAFEQGKHIQFFEQAFEWEQITYAFYPYFWGRKPNWVMIKSINDTDPVFTSFIQAGAARVLVPARPGFEDSVNYFLATQRIWNGKNPPIPSDSLWISIVDELKEQQGQFVGGKQEGTPWIFKIPTSLVYLEKTTFELKDTDASGDYPIDMKQVALSKNTADFS